MSYSFRKYTLFFFALLVGLFANAQATGTQLRGQVLEEGSEESVPYAGIRVKGSTRGVSANDSGYFALAIPEYPVTLIISSIGYQTQELTLTRARRVTIRLKEESTAISPVIVKPGENPAHPIVRSVIKNKKRNNPSNINSYKSGVYRKTLGQLKNIDSAFVEDNAVLRSLKKSMIRQPDSGYLYTIPLMFSEEVKEEVLSRNPYVQYDIPQVTRKDGLSIFEGATLFADYIDIFSREVNFYDDNFSLNGTPLVSPISPFGLSYYHYRLRPDTVYDEATGLREYHIQFLPKNPRNAVFYGEMTVYDSIYALKSIKAKLSPRSNVPFVIRYVVEVDYTLLHDSVTGNLTSFIEKSDLDVDFHIWKFKDEKKRAAANINLYSQYSNVRLDISQEEIEADQKYIVEAKKISEQEMQELRQDTLSAVEKETSLAFTELNKVWWVRFTNQAAIVLGSGYYNVGKIDIGPYNEMVKLNGVEGLRVNAQLRTSNTFHPNFFADAMIGYGFKDNLLKGRLGMGWKFNSRLRRSISIGGEYDTYRVGNNGGHLALLDENAMAINEDMFWISVFAANMDYRYTWRYGSHIAYEHEWRKWLSTTIRYENYNIETGPYTPFTHNGTTVKYFNQQELSLRFRISSNTEHRSDFFARRVYLGNGNLPIISPVITVGMYDLKGANYSKYYAKLHLAIKHEVAIGATQLRYLLEAGTILGSVPFPLLEGHRSIESFVYSSYKFNLLNNLMLASDNYASVLFEYNLNGALLNQIPLLRELNLKEMLNCKLLYSFADFDKHSKVLDIDPTYVYARNSGKPYVEMGVGIQNIFQVLGVGCVWRLPLGNEPSKLPYSHTNFSVIMKISFGG